MTIPRPRICSRVTVPTGGWAYVINISQAAQYDTALSGTVPAGDYFVSGDGQTDDLLFAFVTAVVADGNWPGANAYLGAGIDPSSHKVKLLFCGDEFEGATKQDVQLEWDNMTALAGALGFDSSASSELEGEDHPTTEGDYEVPYNWWANEDGQLLDLIVEDTSSVESLQAMSIDGTIKTQKIAERFTNSLRLQFLQRNRTYSQGIGYTTAPVYPFVRNRALECWWQEAQKGVEFRVYRDHYIATGVAPEQNDFTADTTTTVTQATKTWETDPQRWKNALLYIPDWGENSNENTIPMSYHVASNTATVLTVTAAHPAGLDVMSTGSAGTFYLFDHRYQTYVVNLNQMSTFEPEEIPKLDRYNVTIPLRRYVA